MLILNDICPYERTYAVLNKNICHFGTVIKRVFRKKSIAERYTNDATLPGFFSDKTLGDGPAFWIFPEFNKD